MYDLGPADTGSLCKSATSGKPKDSGEPAHVILQDQGRSARIVIAEDATCFAIIRDRGTQHSSRCRTATGFGNTRTPIHGLTFHNSRSDHAIDSRFERNEVARMELSKFRGMACL